MKRNKYKLTDDAIQVEGRTLYRIRALRIGPWGPAGCLGGYVESGANLSQRGRAWVGRQAMVMDHAQVLDDALVSDHARVSGEAEVAGQARVLDKARVFGAARVFDRALVTGEAWVGEKARVFEEATVADCANVMGSAWVRGEAQVRGPVMLNRAGDVSGDVRIGLETPGQGIAGRVADAVCAVLGLFAQLPPFGRTREASPDSATPMESRHREAEEYPIRRVA